MKRTEKEPLHCHICGSLDISANGICKHCLTPINEDKPDRRKDD